MSDLENRNFEAMMQGLKELEGRIQAVEAQIPTLINQLQTLINQISQLQQSNTLALQQLRGTGATSGTQR